MQKIFLIDGTALIFRAYYAFIRRPLRNSEGKNTSAIFGVVNSFLKLLNRFEPKNIAISFDLKEPTFRKELSEDYKANRPPAPEELNEQVAPIKEFFHKIGIKEFSKIGYEADDALGTLAQKFKDRYEIVFVTSDKDFLQLLDENVTIYDPVKDRFLDEDYAHKKYGINPEQFLDFLAICGDSADNIPGVKGIGKKGAAKLLNNFGTLENIYKNLDKVAYKSHRKKLKNQKEAAFLSKKLAKIVCDVPISVSDDEKFDFDIRNMQNALDLLQKYEIKSIRKKIIKDFLPEDVNIELNQDTKIKFDSLLIDDKDKLDKLLEHLTKQDLLALDTETTSKHPSEAELVGISLCFDDKKAYYLPLNHNLSKNLPSAETLKKLKQSLKNKKIIGHNIKYDLYVLQKHDLQLDNEIFDTIIAHYLLNPRGKHKLDNCADEEFQYEMMPIEKVIGSGKNELTFAQVSSQDALHYAAEDAFITFQLYSRYQKQLEQQNLANLYYEIELPLVRALLQMEKNGVYLDTVVLDEISDKNNRKIADLTHKIYDIAGKQFNINSPQQLSEVLFEDLDIPPLKKTKTGYSTNFAVLSKLARDYPIAKLIIKYRQYTKLQSTYIKALPELINPDTGRIHSSFNQTVASTGRLSSSHPNLQNIPIRTDIGKEIRKAFTTPEKDWVILSADYSQIELRIMAILSGDKKMIKAFNENKDIHAETAAIIFDKNQNEVSADERRYAKVINFGLLYGMGPYRISKELNMDMKEAKDFIKNYFDKFPTIRDFIDSEIEKAKNNLYAETIFGRKLSLPDIVSSSNRRKKAAERIAVNMPIQGSAADVIKIAMIKLYKEIKDNPKIKMIIQVHDELVFEIHQSELVKAKKLIKDNMESVLKEEYKKIVPLKVDIQYGKNWFEAH